ncbi:MAG: DEAD/DEAH box helicase [Candidatus Latescibacteria bacterium]|nr:DEAD/DEAH box helicase [Candidatus Latescibacterota bacterium]
MPPDSPLTPSPLLQLPNTYRAFYGAFAQLHPVQLRAIAPLLEGRDLILQAATGVGKTEAVLAPCLEGLIRSGRASALLYVVPTRALAVDLERRLGPVLSERLGLRLGVRTGEVKRAGGRAPDMLVTTPESLDVALGSGNAEVRHFAQRVGTVVIDEVHPLIHHYRGWQLAYLLRRLERRAAGPLQKVALSATIADAEEVVRFFAFRADAACILEPVQREIAPHLVQVRSEGELAALLDDLYEAWGYRKVLLFANSRSRCDRLFSSLNDQGRFRGVTELHYSNLKPQERRGVERRFRQRRHALCIATSTLELGIDVGDVDGVLLCEPPDSAAAFLQRIGRGNRRSEYTHFWGICRGPDAQLQLIRFLALLRLARQGAVEAPRPRTLPSVLVQQILSCLYEKKRVTPDALADLFPEHRERIARLFGVMAAAGWLRTDQIQGLFRGGWRYREALLERRIWSNFPAGEEDFALNLAGEVIADLPRSVVRQLELGDRVQLAGKRLQVLAIEEGARRQVLAGPADRLDDKEVFWLGAGFRVPYEVAQEMRAVLGGALDLHGQGLFARTRALLQEARDRAARRVRLANGMEVGRGPEGLYRYWTHLGSVGNLILEWAIRHAQAARLEDLAVRADATGVDCSHWIDFQQLSLPTDRAGFAQWAQAHLESLGDLFALNAYWAALPWDLQVAEVVDFLYDQRVADTFAHYRAHSSEIAAGDPAVLELDAAEPAPQGAVWLDPAPAALPLLAWEKQRWAGGAPPAPPEGWYPRALTGTLVGAYIRHQQCARWLRLNFVPPDQRPAGWEEDEAEWAAQRRAQGLAHEARTLAWLQAQGETLRIVDGVDASGHRRALPERLADSLAHLHDLIRCAQAAPEGRFALAQAVLMVPGALGLEGVDGVGIPDLIRVSMGEGGPLLEVGDLKDSPRVHYSQQWQVAFGALLLRTLRERGALPAQAQVANSGFLLLRPSPGEVAPQVHRFALEPYLEAFPQVLQNACEVLSRPPAAADWRLQSHCASCPNFAACYCEALDREEVLFVPQLRAGALEQFRRLGLGTIEAAGAWLAGPPPEADLFDPHQRTLLASRVQALRTQRIGLLDRRTRRFPENLSTAIFVHCVEDPGSGRVRGAAWRALRGDQVVGGEGYFVAAEEDEAALGAAFAEALLRVWEHSVEADRGPHLFHFGARPWEALETWVGATGLAFLWLPGRCHQTDLQQLLGAQFSWPAPGELSLFALGRLLGLEPALDAPESVFHNDDAGWAARVIQRPEAEARQATAAHLDAVLNLELGTWQWAAPHLESGWRQQRWDPAPEPAAAQTAYLNFLEEERRQREEDVLALQAQPLAERVALFRALGPLHFEETVLDEEGRFRYGLRTDPEAGISKFREGDFLKLAPVGSADLQRGFSVVLAAYDRSAGKVWVHSRQGRLALNRRLAYSLEEDLSDWTGPRLVHAVQTVFAADRPHPLAGLLAGNWPVEGDPEGARWAQDWLRDWGPVTGLNAAQERALSLPFAGALGLIEGPPGTGKTHLLGWTLIALVMRARQAGVPLRIAVSALTHQAIDQVLSRVAGLAARWVPDFPGRCFKLGRPAADGEVVGVAPLENAEALAEAPYALVGATGFGLYQLFTQPQGRFPQLFDWVVFDEASQVLVPQALLSLLYGKGRFLFYGDVAQLPPVVLGDYEAEAPGVRVQDSVLARLLDLYGPAHRVRLELSYRMSRELCAFPSRMWYEGALQAAPENAEERLVLAGRRRGDWIDRVLEPDNPVVLVLAQHRGRRQQADEEVEITTALAHRLMVDHGLGAEQLALISPHRAQNNATAERLERLLAESGSELPLIDTVERVQGAERDVIVFAFTSSDLESIQSPFLNNPNRFNVAMTRARKKLIVVGSRAFFAAVPQTEKALAANRCFKAFCECCREGDWVFPFQREI